MLTNFLALMLECLKNMTNEILLIPLGLIVCSLLFKLFDRMQRIVK